MSMECPMGGNFQVVVAAIAEVQRQVDMGDIHQINKPEHVLSISRLPSNRVLVVVYKRLFLQKKTGPLFTQRVVVSRDLTIPTGATADDE